MNRFTHLQNEHGLPQTCFPAQLIGNLRLNSYGSNWEVTQSFHKKLKHGMMMKHIFDIFTRFVKNRYGLEVSLPLLHNSLASAEFYRGKPALLMQGFHLGWMARACSEQAHLCGFMTEVLCELPGGNLHYAHGEHAESMQKEPRPEFEPRTILLLDDRGNSSSTVHPFSMIHLGKTCLMYWFYILCRGKQVSQGAYYPNRVDSGQYAAVLRYTQSDKTYVVVFFF